MTFQVRTTVGSSTELRGKSSMCKNHEFSGPAGLTGGLTGSHSLPFSELGTTESMENENREAVKNRLVDILRVVAEGQECFGFRHLPHVSLEPLFFILDT